MCYDLTDFEWSVIEPILPTGLPGPQRRDNRRVLNGIFWVLRAGAPWRAICRNGMAPTQRPTIASIDDARRASGTELWTSSQKLTTAICKFDFSVIRVHQHAFGAKKGGVAWAVRAVD